MDLAILQQTQNDRLAYRQAGVREWNIIACLLRIYKRPYQRQHHNTPKSYLAHGDEDLMHTW